MRYETLRNSIYNSAGAEQHEINQRFNIYVHHYVVWESRASGIPLDWNYVLYCPASVILFWGILACVIFSIQSIGLFFFLLLWTIHCHILKTLIVQMSNFVFYIPFYASSCSAMPPAALARFSMSSSFFFSSLSCRTRSRSTSASFRSVSRACISAISSFVG